MSKISLKLQVKIRLQANNRCGYCLLPQVLNPTLLEIEHIHPIAEGGTDDEENLWLACRECNSHKSNKTHSFNKLTNKKTKLFNPRKQVWANHFKFSHDKTEIIGKTACGRATVETLKMNSSILVSVRKLWVEFDLFPPKD
jgi:hypothetical protein